MPRSVEHRLPRFLILVKRQSVAKRLRAAPSQAVPRFTQTRGRIWPNRGVLGYPAEVIVDRAKETGLEMMSCHVLVTTETGA